MFRCPFHSSVMVCVIVFCLLPLNAGLCIFPVTNSLHNCGPLFAFNGFEIVIYIVSMEKVLSVWYMWLTLSAVCMCFYLLHCGLCGQVSGCCG